MVKTTFCRRAWPTLPLCLVLILILIAIAFSLEAGSAQSPEAPPIVSLVGATPSSGATPAAVGIGPSAIVIQTSGQPWWANPATAIASVMVGGFVTYWFGERGARKRETKTESRTRDSARFLLRVEIDANLNRLS